MPRVESSAWSLPALGPNLTAWVGGEMSGTNSGDALSEIMAAVRQEDRPRALALAVAAWRGGGSHPLVLMLAAEALEAQGEADQAIGLLKAALAVSDEPELWRRYGAALARGQQFADAAEAFEEALDIDGSDLAALRGAAAARFQGGEMAAADAAYRRILALAPQDLGALTGLAAVAVRRRQFDEARGFARQALAAAPGDLSASMTLARADLLEGRAERAAAQASALLARPDLGLEPGIALLDLRAEALDALDRPAEAFADYAERNARIERGAEAEIRAMGERRIDQARRLQAFFAGQDPAAWRTPPQAGADDAPVKGHVFLLGFPRSGTTLLEKALASHPQASSLEEIDHLDAAAGDLLATEAGLGELLTLSAAQAAARRARYWEGVGATVGGELSGKVVVDKMPLHTLALPLIARLFPGARILFALRDPRDVALSCFRRRFQLNSAMYEFLTPERTAAYYDAVMTLGMLYRDRLPLALCEVRHEAVVADFDAEVAKVLAFIGLDWDPAVRGFAARAQARARTPSDLQLVGGLSDAGIGQWRRYERQLTPVRPILDRWAERFGYAP